MAEAPMEEFLARNTGDSDEDKVFRQDMKESMRVGYSTGNDRENQQGHDPETGYGLTRTWVPVEG